MTSDRPQEDLAIRAKPRPVTRFNKRVLIATAAIASAVILGTAGFALRAPERANASAPRELYNTTNKPMPDAFNALPANYAEASSQLGPPLPGDLGAAFISKEREAPLHDNPFQYQGAAGTSSSGASHASTISEARTSELFFIKSQPGRPETAHSPDPGQPAYSEPSIDQLAALWSGGAGASGAAAPFDQNRQDRKEAFLNGDVDAAIYNRHRLQTPASPYQVMAGTIIPASLITGLNSDLPGQVIAQVTENVYDTATGAYLLIPQGARLIGNYDSVIAYGQSRALMVWSRIIMPDGSSITIENLPGTDLAGYAGVKDRVDHHTWKLFQAAILSSVFSVASELGRDSDDDALLEALRDGGQRTINQAGQQIVTRQLSQQPTIRIRPGWRLRVIVNQDLILEPYGE